MQDTVLISSFQLEAVFFSTFIVTSYEQVVVLVTRSSGDKYDTLVVIQSILNCDWLCFIRWLNHIT